MRSFVTRKVEEIKAKELVEELYTNNLGELERFELELEGTTYGTELNTLKKYIEHFANGNSVGDRVDYLKGVKDGVTEYEFRSKHLRIYAIQQPGKKIIIFSGVKKKADSSDNIAAFRTIKKEFIKSLTSKI